MLTAFREKVKTRLALIRDDVVLVSVVALVAAASFGVGRLAALNAGRARMRVEIPAPISTVQLGAAGEAIKGQEPYVASRNGNRYYFPWCAGVERIKEDNKVWFATKEDAEAAGYTKAQNCKGL